MNEEKNWLIEGYEKLEGKHYDFKQYLTDKEAREFEIDEKQLRDQEMDLIRKYTKVTGDRLTRDTLTKTIIEEVTIAGLSKMRRYFPVAKSHAIHGEKDGKLTIDWVRTENDPTQMFLDLLAEQDNKTLQAILNVLHMIELPKKEPNDA